MPSEGSPPLSFSSFDWKSVLWTLLTAAIAAVLTAVVDSVLPDLKDKGLIDATLFTLLTTLLHALRKYLTDTRVIVVVAILSLLLTAPGAATAEEVAVIIDDAKPGTVLITVAPDRSVSVSSMRIIRVSPAPPGPTPTPAPTPGPVLTARGTILRDLAAKATGDKKRDETAVMLAVLYSELAKRVRTGEIPLDKLAGVMRDGADRVLGLQGAPPEAWKATRDQIAFYLTSALQEGPESCGKLLEESAAGLEASVPRFQAGAIDREKLKQIIIQIIILILSSL